MSSSRDQIFARVTAALAPLPQRAALPDWDRELIQMRASQPATDLWTQFAERLKAVNGTPLTSVADLVALLEKNGWKHGYCDPVHWPRFKDAFPVGFMVETTFDRTRMDDYAFGLTAATAAIAETGTLILTDRDTSRRLGALAPWLHIAVLKRDQIFPDITAAIAAQSGNRDFQMTSPEPVEWAGLPDDPNVIWVTGPSKTADIEGILIEGVHGPGRQVALLVN